MPSFAAQSDLLKGIVDGILRQHEGGGGFESQAQVDVFTVGNATLNAAGAVGAGADAPVVHVKGVIVLTAAELGSTESAANLKSFASRDAQHGVSERGLQFVKDRVTQTNGAVADGAGNYAAQGIPLTAGGADSLSHLLGSGGVCRADDVCFYGGGIYIFRPDRAGDVVYAFYPADDFQLRAERLCHGSGYGTCGNAADGFTRAGASAAGPGAYAVFGIVAVVCVGGAVGVLHFIIRAGAVVFVADGQGNGGAQSQTVQHAAENFYSISFIARGDDVALPRAAAVQLLLNHFLSEWNTWGAAVYNDTDSGAVRFSPGADAKQSAECAGHNNYRKSGNDTER